MAAIVALVALSPPSPASAEPGVRIRSGIVYASPDGVPLKLDAYLPVSPGPHPAVILIHGGAWTLGYRSYEVDLAASLVKADFAAFAVDYRLAPEFPFPAAVEDVRAAVTWVRAHAAEYDIDPAAIGAIGESAGGHLAAMLAMLGTGPLDTGSRIAAAVSWSGPMDLAALLRDAGDVVSQRFTIRGLVEQFLGCHGASCQGLLRDASPVSFIDPSDAPMLLVNSTQEIIPLTQATEMTDELHRAGVSARVIEMPGKKHAGEYANDPVPGSSSSVLEVSIAFLCSQLPRAPGPVGTTSGGGPVSPLQAAVAAVAVACVAGALFRRKRRVRRT